MPGKSIQTWLILWRTTRAVEIYAQKSIVNLGLGVTDFAVLEALLHKGPLLIKDLGRLVLLTSGSMTAAVDRLEQQGLLERQDVPGDRRAYLVNLTARGKAQIKKAFAKHEEDIDQLLGSALNKAERGQLAALLLKVRTAADERSVRR